MLKNKNFRNIAFFMRKRKVMQLIVLIAVIAVMAGRIVWEQTERETENFLNDTSLLIGKKEGNEFVELDAKLLNIDDSFLEELEVYVKEFDYTKVNEEIRQLTEDGSEGFLVSDISNLSVSTYMMPVINIAAQTVSAVYQFLFENGEPVGDLMFYEYEGQIDYTISLYTKNTGGCYVNFLRKEDTCPYIAVADGYVIYFLSEENCMYDPLTGEEETEITITGDCYHSFGENFFVSYKEIAENIK